MNKLLLKSILLTGTFCATNALASSQWPPEGYEEVVSGYDYVENMATGKMLLTAGMATPDNLVDMNILKRQTVENHISLQEPTVSDHNIPEMTFENITNIVAFGDDPEVEETDIDQAPTAHVINSVSINNIEAIFRDVLESTVEKLVVLDMDEFLLGRIDETRNRVLLNLNLVDIVSQMRLSGADIIVVSQSSEDTIHARINGALKLAGFNETFDDLFSAGICSHNASSKAEVIMTYIRENDLTPKTIFFGDDILENLNLAAELIQGLNLNLYHFNDERIIHFNAVEQYQANHNLYSFADAEKQLRDGRGISRYIEKDVREDIAVEGFAERAQATYQHYMSILGLSTQREVVQILRQQNGYDANNNKHDTEILRKIWQQNSF